MGLLRRILGRLKRTIAATPPEVTARLDHHDHALRDITDALQDVQAGVTRDTRGRVDALDAALPRVLNNVASQEGMLRQNRRELNSMNQRISEQEQISLKVHAELGELWSRIEMVRRETLFELRYNAGASGTAAPVEHGAVDAKIVDVAKFEAAAAEGLRLNLGAGHVPLDGYVNVDMRELPGVDVVATLDDLPVEAGSVAEIFSSHVLEHFPIEQLERQMLPYWVSLLEPGGTFRAVVPDGGAMLAGYAAGTVPFADLREVLYGGQEYEGDFHFDLFTTDTLGDALRGAGLDEVEIEAAGRPNGICLEFQIVARKPG